MSSTLIMRKTPAPRDDETVSFKLPVKAILARRFYDHDGSLGGGMVTVGPEELGWFEGVLAGADRWSRAEVEDFKKMVGVLRDGGSVDMWFEN
jgi:hypothetical protein